MGGGALTLALDVGTRTNNSTWRSSVRELNLDDSRGIRDVGEYDSGKDPAPAQSQNQMENRFVLDVVIIKRAAIIELFACKDESLLVCGNPFFVLHKLLDAIDCCIQRADEGDVLASECLDIEDDLSFGSDRNGYGAVGQSVAKNAVVVHGLVMVLEFNAVEEEVLAFDGGFVGSEPCMNALEEEEDGLVWFVADVDCIVRAFVGDDDIE